MPTSGTIDFGLVANQIIEKAFFRLGVGSEGEAITARMYADGMMSLNLLVKAWGAREHLWLRTNLTVPLVASQAGYIITPKPMRITDVRRRLTVGAIETPLRELSRSQYLDQSNKGVASIPNSFYYDPQRTTGTLYLWPTASAQTVTQMDIRLTYLRRMDDFDNSNDEPDLPQEWLEALIWNLADNLQTEYPVNNPRISQKIEANAALTLAAIEAFDTEPASIFLQPEANWQSAWGN